MVEEKNTIGVIVWGGGLIVSKYVKINAKISAKCLCMLLAFNTKTVSI